MRFLGRDNSFFASLGPVRPSRLEEFCKVSGKAVSYQTYGRAVFVKIFQILAAGSGGEVLMPVYMCGTLVDAARASGLTPRFYDLDAERDLDYSSDDIRASVNPATKAVVFADYFGVEARRDDSLLEWLKTRRVFTIKDAAHAYLTLEWKGFESARLYDATVLSPYKTVPSMIGGILIHDGRIPAGDSVDFIEFIRRCAKQTVKSFLGRSFARIGTRGMIELHYQKEQGPSATPLLTMSGAYKRLLSRLSTGRLSAERRRTTAAYLEFLRPLPRTLVRGLFSQRALTDAVLMGFPFYFERRDERDRWCLNLRNAGVDAFTWPIFSDLNCGGRIWDHVLLVPVSYDVSRFLKRILSKI